MSKALPQRFGTFLSVDANESVGALATQIRAAERRAFLRIRNTHASQILYIGKDNTVSATVHHWMLAAGAEVDLSGYEGPIWAFASGAATTFLCLAGDS